METSIYDTALLAKKGDPIALSSLIQIFKPLIYKYGRHIDGEDTEQDLTLLLWQLLYKLPLQNDDLHENKMIFSYIAKSLERQYFKLSKRRSRMIEAEIDLPSNFTIADPHDFTRRLCLNDLIRRLNPSEYRILVWIYCFGYSVKEIAAVLHISRQAVNQMKIRALRKLRKFYSN